MADTISFIHGSHPIQVPHGNDEIDVKIGWTNDRIILATDDVELYLTSKQGIDLLTRIHAALQKVGGVDISRVNEKLNVS